ncbi:MAG: PAS domain S-box protein, partial [Deltaproteobacteria bacterium]|nr:PAS domain S-box protein [Deltaproteobacteria bacterium]
MIERNVCILLVEDNPGDVRLIQEFLCDAKMISFQVEVAERLSDGLKALSEGRFDVVLLDLSLPDSSGLDTLEKMLSRTQQVAIIVLTGLSDEDLALEAMRKGAQDYLVKGHVDEHLLSRAIRYAIERKRAEEALRESGEKYRNILESIEEGYYEVDTAGNFSFFNDAICKMLGYTNDEVMGMNSRQYIDKESAKRLCQTFNRVYKTGEPTKIFDFEIIRKDTTKGYVETSVSLMKDAEGNSTGFRGIIRDITKRKQTKTELIQAKNFLQNILDSSIDGITTTDLQGNLIYTSPRTKDILGYVQEAAISKKGYSFYSNGIKDAKTIMKELTTKGEIKDHEMKLIRKDDTLIDINLSASLLRNEEGEIIGTLGIYRNI